MEDHAPPYAADSFARDSLPPAGLWPRLGFDPDAGTLEYPAALNCAAELLDGTIARHGADRPALYDATGRVWSYGALRDRVDRIAAVLTADLGVRPGNRVLLRGPNTPALAACWLGVLKAGAVAVTTMPLLRSGELATVIRLARAQFALCDARYTAELAGALGAGTRMLTYLSAEPDAPDAELETLMAHRLGGFTAVATAADDVALIAFTSGTSGAPKATAHFHRDVLAIADTFSAHVVRPVPDDLFTGSPPLAFTFGLGGLLVFPLRAGAAALLLEQGAPRDLFAAADKFGATVLFTAPTAYRAFLREGAPAPSGLRRCVSAGEVLPEQVRTEFQAATGLRIIDGLGSTEMLHVFISAADDEIRSGAIGRVVPGFTARVVGPDGLDLPDGTPGHLAVRGPTGCRYLNDPRQRDYVRGGWNITGDICVRDADGYFSYLSRADDMIVTAGYNVGPPEVEQAVLSHPAVAECAVVGAPDPGRGTVIKAFVVLRPGFEPGDELVAGIQSFVKQAIAPYKYPRLIEFVAELPRSSTGKLRRSPLRALAAGAPADAEPTGPLTEVRGVSA